MFNLKQMIEKANEKLNTVANKVTESKIYESITNNKYYKAVDSACDAYDVKAEELAIKHQQWLSTQSVNVYNKVVDVVSTTVKGKDNVNS